MSFAVSAILSIFDLEKLDDNRFLGPQPKSAMQPLFGGHVIGQTIVAASRTIEGGRPIHSLHGYFLHPGDASQPLTFEVERVRDGGSFSARRVVASQAGRVIWVADTSFHDRISGFERADPMPASVDPEKLPSLMEMFTRSSGVEGEWGDLDVRWGGPWPPQGEVPSGHPGHNQLWFRTKETIPDDPVLHAAILGYTSDLTFLTPVLLPHGAFMWTPGLKVASLDHAIWFHRPFRVDDWLLYDQLSPVASGGRGLALGTIYTAAGERVVSTAQEGLVRAS